MQNNRDSISVETIREELKSELNSIILRN